MSGKPNKHAPHSPEANSALWKVLEFGMGPGLMLAVLMALAVHLIVSDHASELRLYAAQDRSAGQ